MKISCKNLNYSGSYPKNRVKLIKVSNTKSRQTESFIESIFVELISEDNNTKNWILGYIYKHPRQYEFTNEFTEDFINTFLCKLSTENKPAFTTKDFNINFLNCDSVNTMHCHYFTPFFNMLQE